LLQKVSHLSNVVSIKPGKFFDFFRRLPMVRERVKRSAYSASRVNPLAAIDPHLEGHHAGQIGRERQHLQIRHQLHVRIEAVGHTRRRAWPCAGMCIRILVLHLLNAPLHVAHRVQILDYTAAVRRAAPPIERCGHRNNCVQVANLRRRDLQAGGKVTRLTNAIRWPLRLGIHTFTAKSLEQAAITAAELGANTFQIFSASPRMWRARAADPDQIRLFRAARDRFGLAPLAIHVNYLINLASEDPEIRAKSVAGFRGELDRAAAIGADYLVIHPGSYRGRSVEAGIASFARALGESAGGFRANGLTVLLENTAGAGCCLGSRFAELHAIREASAALTDLPVGYCLDTCHLLAAGFDIATAAGLRLTLDQAEESLGLAHVHLIHANDSQTPLGSRRDRHAGIGQGYIGLSGFRRILRHPLLRSKPFVLETPIHSEGDDRRNLDTLKALAASRFTKAPRVLKS
jgi:deoxyribonuclease IV